MNQKPLIEFCTAQNITVTGYSPLGQPGNRSGIPNSLDHPTITELAKKYNKSAAQVALRYVVSNCASVPLSSRMEPRSMSEQKSIDREIVCLTQKQDQDDYRNGHNESFFPQLLNTEI